MYSSVAQPITFPSPGFLGLNKEREQSILTPEWATEAQNCVIDEAGRLAARKGITVLTTSAASGTPTMDVVHEYVKSDSTTSIIAAGGNALWESSDDGASWTARTGALSPTDDNAQFANFNNKVICLSPGIALSVKTTGNFAAITAASGTVPTSPVAILSAFGRLWVLTKTNLYWCALLDETRWASADGGGVQDLNYLWTKGQDEGVALGAFGSTLVVFGKNHIILLTDGRGSDRGIDPTTMYVGDTLENVGCIARDTVQPIGEGDLIFASQNGIRSLARTIQEKQTPLNDVTANNRRHVTASLISSSISTAKMRGCTAAEEGFYLLISPDSNVTFCVDIRRPLEDGTYRITEWPGHLALCAARRKSGQVIFGLTGGRIGAYSGYLDGTATYRMIFRSGWMDLGEANAVLKILKRMKLIAFSPAGVAVTLKWFFDFKRDFGYDQILYAPDGVDEYGIGEWGTAEYSGGVAQRIDYVPASGSGQYLLLGAEVEINSRPFAIQSLTAYYVPGRMA